VYLLCIFELSITKNNFHILTIYVNIYVKLTTDNTTTAGINYKELYDSTWDPMTLTNNTLLKTEFTFFIIILAQ